jgi:hypothetical protein
MMFVMGDLIIDVWMGEKYASWPICAVLAAGYLLPMSQGGLLRVLVGLNAHGTIAKYGLAAAGVLLTLGIATLSITGWSLTRAAILIALPTGIGLGVCVLVAGVRYLDITIREYAAHALLPALRLLLAVGFAVAAARFLSPYSSGVTVLIGLVLTALITLFIHRRDAVRVWIAARA